jgi:hypothetical protein
MTGPAAIVQGIVRHDAGNDCITLKRHEPRFPVIWPEGTRGIAARPDVELPDGRSAVVGETVFGGGGYLLVGCFVNRKDPNPRRLHTSTREIAVFNTNTDIEALVATELPISRPGVLC